MKHFFHKSRFASLALVAFFLVSFLFFSGYSYNERLNPHRAQTFDKQRAPISPECSSIQKRDGSPIVRPLLCKNINISLQDIDLLTTAAAACAAQDTYQKFSKDFLNLSILSCKHHPPTC